MEKLNLKDRRLVRIFISSPFNGLEKERDLLTKFYWPRIESSLNSKGLHLRLVDMRWGITQSSAANAQTVLICLREIDRSDLFIGLFAQRYGWHGVHDEVLQKNIDNALGQYPWLNNYRHGSVTEQEFIHGHLNNPGALPACFCFRDASYDAKQLKEARKEGDTKRQSHFRAESTESGKLLADLKKRIIETKQSTLGVAQDYKDPSEAAEFIFNSVMKHIEEKILSQLDEPASVSDRSLQAHGAYLRTHLGVYVGGSKYHQTLDEHMVPHEQTILAVVGPSGSGKTSIITNWLHEKVHSNLSTEKEVYFYHFVGAEPESVKAKNIMTRLLDCIAQVIPDSEKPTENASDRKLALALKNSVQNLAKDEYKHIRWFIIVDKADRILAGKRTRPFYWLPDDLPPNVRVILSMNVDPDSPTEDFSTLEKERNIKIMQAAPLTQEEKHELCLKLLEENSKGMEAGQLEKIISSGQTNDPHFLTILLNELRIAGKFRQLDRQIETLLRAENVSGLFRCVIERVCADYTHTEYDGNIVEDVLCAIRLCKRGISEEELDIPQHVLTPLIYALEGFLTDSDGLLVFAFDGFRDVVETLYMQTEEQKRARASRVANIFYKLYKNSNQNVSLNLHVAVELPHLLLCAKDNARLLEVISDIRVYEQLNKKEYYDINDYWQALGTPAEVIARRYLRSLDTYISGKYADDINSWAEDHVQKLTMEKSILISKLRSWFADSKMFKGVELLLDREIDLDSVRPGPSDLRREDILCDLLYQKACFLSDSEKTNEALELHMKVLAMREKLIEGKVMQKVDLGLSYHGIGLCYFKMKDMDQAEMWYNKALKVQDTPDKRVNQSTTYCNLGLISLKRNLLQEALKYFNKSNELRMAAEPDIIGLEVAYNYHNIALAYRRLKDYDAAQTFYAKSQKVKENLLGKQSFDVALTLMNRGTLENARKNLQAALDFAQESLAILQVVAPKGFSSTMMVMENVCNQLTLLDRYEEAVPLFKEVREYLQSLPEGVGAGLGPVHRRFYKWYAENGDPHTAVDIALDLLKSSKAKESDLVFILQQDSELDEKPSRPEWATLEYGMEKWPSSAALLAYKLEDVLKQNNQSSSAIVDFSHTFAQKCTAEEAQCERYCTIVDALVEYNERVDLAIKVLEGAVNRVPGNKSLGKKLDELKKTKVSQT